MSKAFKNERDKLVTTWLDDIVTYSDTLRDRLYRI